MDDFIEDIKVLYDEDMLTSYPIFVVYKLQILKINTVKKNQDVRNLKINNFDHKIFVNEYITNNDSVHNIEDLIIKLNGKLGIEERSEYDLLVNCLNTSINYHKTKDFNVIKEFIENNLTLRQLDRIGL